MSRNIVYSLFTGVVLFCTCALQGCGQHGKPAGPPPADVSAYVNFGHNVAGQGCKETGVCRVGRANNQEPNLNTVFQYYQLQRQDSTDSITMRFYPNRLRPNQDTSNFVLDSMNRYWFSTEYVFDDSASAITNIPVGTTIPAKRYAVTIATQQQDTIWTILIPGVERPQQHKGKY
jgi:hypothetical protein